MAKTNVNSKFFGRLLCLVLFLLLVSLTHSSFSLLEGKSHQSPLAKLLRIKRDVCIDGIYEHEGRNCCLCAAGQHLMQHCVSTPDDRICEMCKSGTYNSHPNSQETCLPCTSCSQPNANLEESESCTVARDTQCRCKINHYCSSNTGDCKICHPCTVCGSSGVKEACTATSDTVCNETKDSSSVALIVGIVIGLLLAAVVFFFLGKKVAERTRQPVPINGDNSVPLVTVQNVDLQPLLPDIAEVLGWKDMEHLAMRSGVSDAVIESCKLDRLGDSQEQTLQLLRRWVERYGRDAQRKMIQILEESGKKAKVEKIKAILATGNPTI